MSQNMLKFYPDGWIKCKKCRSLFKVEFAPTFYAKFVNYCPHCGQKNEKGEKKLAGKEKV